MKKRLTEGLFPEKTTHGGAFSRKNDSRRGSPGDLKGFRRASLSHFFLRADRERFRTLKTDFRAKPTLPFPTSRRISLSLYKPETTYISLSLYKPETTYISDHDTCSREFQATALVVRSPFMGFPGNCACSPMPFEAKNKARRPYFRRPPKWFMRATRRRRRRTQSLQPHLPWPCVVCDGCRHLRLRLRRSW